MTGQKYVCIDLDGTIAHYVDWQGEAHFGEPVEGVQKALKRLRAAGWKIIVFTSRGDKQLISAYLHKHHLPHDCINENPEHPDSTSGKPYADVYIDDRGLQFNGDWDAAVDEVLRFVPWEKREPPTPEEDRRQEAAAFLARDYDQAFSQMRVYDTQIWEILKYSFGQLVASLAAVWAIFTLTDVAAPPPLLGALWEPVSATVLVISFLFGLLAIQLILRNRVYFTEAARYINEQRNFFLTVHPLGFKNLSRYYTDYSFPKPFSINSSQITCVYVIAFIDSLLLGFGAGLLGHYFGLLGKDAVLLGLAAWAVAFIFTLWISLDYLEKKKKFLPNAAGYGKI